MIIDAHHLSTCSLCQTRHLSFLLHSLIHKYLLLLIYLLSTYFCIQVTHYHVTVFFEFCYILSQLIQKLSIVIFIFAGVINVSFFSSSKNCFTKCRWIFLNTDSIVTYYASTTIIYVIAHVLYFFSSLFISRGIL